MDNYIHHCSCEKKFDEKRKLFIYVLEILKLLYSCDSFSYLKQNKNIHG